MTDTLPVEPVEDEDLEASPYGHRNGAKRRAGHYDLASGRHRVRNVAENYRHLARFGLHHGEILSRLGLSDEEWATVHTSARLQGIPLPIDSQPTIQEEGKDAWKCGKKWCTRCGGSR